MLNFPWRKSGKLQSENIPPQVRVKTISSQAISPTELQALDFANEDTQLVLAFVSPHLNFAQIAKRLKQAMPFAKHVIAIMTAGELSGEGNEGLYHHTDNDWDNIVLQSFASNTFAEISIAQIPLHCEDIKQGKAKLHTQERIQRIEQEIQRIEQEIKRVNVPFSVSATDTDVV